jgi:hypothetical protein
MTKQSAISSYAAYVISLTFKCNNLIPLDHNVGE